MSVNILVGDIGSTKSTWWSNLEANTPILLPGYNPIVHAQAVGKLMFEQLWHVTEGEPFSKIWYYGTGVVDEPVAFRVKEEIKKYFPGADIAVASDLLGAARAACGTKEGIIVILGTGSHAATFDGERIDRQASSLGYLLGDEGSGCDIGKALIRAFFYNQMPVEIAEEMKNRIPNGRSAFLQQLYLQDRPNEFLADFTRIAVAFQEHPWVKNLVTERFQVFIKTHLLPLHPATPIHVIGSIGTIFAGLFRQALQDVGLQPGEFIPDPARRMFEIHVAHE